MTAEVLTLHLGWNRPLEQLSGRGWRKHGIELFVDFAWEESIGHR
jgi:hypothetical protein